MIVRQESDSLPRAVLLGVTVAVIVATAVGVAVAALLLVDKHRDLGGQPFTGDAELHPPREVSGLEMMLFDERSQQVPAARQDAEALERWEWADPAAGLVRVPVSRAIDLYLEERRARRQGGAP